MSFDTIKICAGIPFLYINSQKPMPLSRYLNIKTKLLPFLKLSDFFAMIFRKGCLLCLKLETIFK